MIARVGRAVLRWLGSFALNAVVGFATAVGACLAMSGEGAVCCSVTWLCCPIIGGAIGWFSPRGVPGATLAALAYLASRGPPTGTSSTEGVGIVLPYVLVVPMALCELAAGSVRAIRALEAINARADARPTRGAEP